MSAPNVDPRFATAATYTVDGDDWGSAANKIDPGSGRKAEGLEPGMLPAEWLNWLLNLFGAWLYWIAARLGGLDGSGEWNYETARGRSVMIPGAEVVNGLTAGAWTSDEGGGALCQANGAFAILPLNRYLPTGCTLTSIVGSVSSAHTSTSGMRFRVMSDAGQIGSTFHSGTTAGSSAPASGTITTAIDRSAHVYWLEILSSDQAATTPPGDRVFSITVNINVPGPEAR